MGGTLPRGRKAPDWTEAAPHASVTATRIDLAGDHMARPLDLVATYGAISPSWRPPPSAVLPAVGEGRAALPYPSARPRT
jgi:hypothetical protein